VKAKAISLILAVSSVYLWARPISYIVQPGDTLGRIAKGHGSSVSELVRLNQLTNPDLLRVGQNLKLAFAKSKQDDSGSKGKKSSSLMDGLHLQVQLDRAGFTPGVIDGRPGKFTRLAHDLCRKWNPAALTQNVIPIKTIKVPAIMNHYVDVTLPGSGHAPDFKALTAKKRILRYKSSWEFLAERYHCSVKLLQLLNPTLEGRPLESGASVTVPNVIAFEVESYLQKGGERIWNKRLGHGSARHEIRVSRDHLLLTLWDEGKMLRSFPITLNKRKTPSGILTLSKPVPSPPYNRKKTDLLAGPNSPVGIIWCSLGDGFGIHGTSNPDAIGRNTSAGCIRLANWDIVRLAGMVREGTTVVIQSDLPQLHEQSPKALAELSPSSQKMFPTIK